MPVVLVVEQDTSYAQRIAAALSVMGHDVDLVADAESAARQAAVRAPHLVVVSGSLPDAESTLARYSQRRGGPGSLVMAPLAHAGQVSAEQFQADLLLYKPFSEDDLRQAVGRLLSRSAASNPPATAPSAPPTTAPTTVPAAASPQPDATVNPLTSADIFGDVLAEVEQEARRAEARPPQPAAPPSAPSRPAAAQSTPAAAVPPPRRPAPAKPRERSGDDINRKLEETLSGVLPDKLRRQDKPRPSKRRVKPTDDDIDSLLDKTLSSLELPRKVRRQKTPGAAPATPVARQQQPADPPNPTAVKPTAPAPAAVPPAAQAPPATNAPAPTPAPAAQAPTTLPATPPTRPEEAAPSLSPSATTAPPPPPISVELPTASPASFERAEAETPSFVRPSFEPPDIPALEIDSPAESFELPPTEPAIPPTISAENKPAAFEPPSIDLEPASIDFEPPAASPSSSLHSSPFEAFDTAEPDPGAAMPADGDAPTGWSVTSFEDAETSEPTPSSYATELVPSAADNPPTASAPPSEDTFTDVEFPSDFAAAFAAPPAEPEIGEDTGGALEKVLEVRGAATPQDEGTPFGDYRLLDRVAVGGMAEVWRARRRGVEGFQKTVAIKRILYHLTGNDDFVTMFIDEAKLAAQLHHAHIVQIYDLGKVDDDFFIAMEYVDGKDLRTILNQANQVGVRLPLRLALEIVTAVAKALDYAHRKKDDNDRDLGLVHRDVSPQNVLIGYESEIKLCDFGIVKAVVKASTTQMGALKGKLQYMSPEQAWGREVDSRSDIFSLGSVLFEVLTGERLFTGDSEIGVLDAVRDGKVRSPRELNPEIPESVEQIALRALTEDPDRRYQTADEMVRDLSAALEGLGPAPQQLGEFLGTLFPRPTTSGIRDISAPEPADPPSMVAEPTTAPQAASGGRARSLLIAAIVVTALLAIGTIVFFSLRGGDEPAAPSTMAPVAAPETDPPAGDPAAADGEAEGAATPADPDRVQQLIDQAVQDQRDQLEADYEERRRLLEKELAEVQGDGSGP